MTDSTDRILVENTLHGDEHAFAELVERYQAAIWRTVRRKLVDHFESEDAMQEVFLRAYTSLHKFDLDRPFDRWILRIATNYCIDVLRRRRARQPWLLTEYKETPAPGAWNCRTEQSCWTPSELRRVARLLLNAVKTKNRTAFVLRELEGLEYAQVAKTLKISPLAARVRVSRARQEMHRKLRFYLHSDTATAPSSLLTRQPLPAGSLQSLG
jgi:RNA polymerase sigma-70 factor (ECF subfamily)